MAINSDIMEALTGACTVYCSQSNSSDTKTFVYKYLAIS